MILSFDFLWWIKWTQVFYIFLRSRQVSFQIRWQKYNQLLATILTNILSHELPYKLFLIYLQNPFQKQLQWLLLYWHQYLYHFSKFALIKPLPFSEALKIYTNKQYVQQRQMTCLELHYSTLSIKFN